MEKNNVKKGLVFAFIFLFVAVSFQSVFANNNLEKSVVLVSDGNTLYVGGSGQGNYSRIQDAIDNASDRDTIFVYNGTYYENVIIDKSINLIGEDRNSTIIDGGGSGDVITITNDNVLLINFTIQNGGYYPFYALVKITSNSNTISNNTVIHAFHGIWLDNSDLNDVSGNYITLSLYGGICLKDHSEYNIISKNIIYNAGAGGGIQFEDSNNNTVLDNYVSDTDTGIEIGGSSINTIEKNTFFNNSLGLYLVSSYNNLFNYNIIETNYDFGVLIYDSNNNVIYHNNFVNNSVNALDYGNNNWDDGYPSGGNYWDDYIGEDNNDDGIGDTPYNISGGNNQDLYPLTDSFEKYLFLQMIIPDTPIFEADNFPILIRCFKNLPVQDAIVEFNDLFALTDSNGVVYFTAPTVDMDSYYEINATKTGYTGANETILIKNVPREFKNVFIFGRITNFSRDGEYINFEAVKTRVFTIDPLGFTTYLSGERFNLSKEYKGFIGLRCIFAWCKMVFIQ